MMPGCGGGRSRLVLVAGILLLISISQLASAADYTYFSSSNNVIDDSYSVNSLTPNQFYKICPRSNRAKSFGQPTCGDGTGFCFFFSRPAQRKENRERILIELMGGGACWDANTCNKMASYLTFPEDLDNFVGLSCSEINAGLQQDGGGDKPINMLCGQTIGDTDFASYNTVVIPYCTQDVHVGSNILDYSSENNNNDGNQGRRLEDGGDTTVRHMGAHNVMSTLRWVFKNFPSASHIALTGCSAGGTGVPIVYDLVRKHYNHFGIRKVQINTIADSPVYLTPSYFLENALDHWNPWKMLNRVGFNYKKYRYSEEYPTAAWDYILRKGMNRDRWGFVSHTDDPVSLTYYQYMSGNGDDNRRRLDDQDLESQWYSELTTSIETIQAKHSNVETYWINDEGHCSFGLYYAMQQEGFEEWAGSIFRENTVSMARRPAVGAFVVAALIGVGLAFGIAFVSRKQSRSSSLHINNLVDDENIQLPGVWRNMVRQTSVALETNESMLSEQSSTTVASKRRRCKTLVISQLSKLAECPITTGLALTITIFFWTMIITEGFAHPLNNPSLGPSAIGLSRYGINNPSLIVYKHQWFRIITANFLCSGVLTYLIVMIYLAFPVRSLEKTLSNSLQTVWIMTLVALGINLLYAWTLEGATCSSLAFALGLQTCHLVIRWQRGLENRIALPITFVILVFLLGFAFPFDSQWMILASALVFGPVIGTIGLRETSKQVEESSAVSAEAKDSNEYVGGPMNEGVIETEPTNRRASEESSNDEVRKDDSSNNYVWRKEALYVYAVWFLLVAFGIGFNGPSQLNLEPFYTGCQLYYSTDVAGIASSYSNGGEERRLEEEQNEDASICAEFCIPHLASRFVQLGVQTLGISASKGQCQDAGYVEHVADKTFAYMGYSLDVEVYNLSE